MIAAGDLVVVAVSGGPDSMCLLDALSAVSPQLQIQLHAAYLHHHMREQADADARLVHEYAESLGIPCTVGHADVPKIARENKLGVEEAGRLARYSFLRNLRRDVGACKIAMGHNRNDQAETVLMRLLRGSGTAGLAGIPPVRGDIIRPLIDVSRAAIEDYCSARGIPTIVDVYNLDLRYTRNLVRHETIPNLVEKYNPSLVDTLAWVAEVLRWDSDYLDRCADSAFGRFSRRWARLTTVDQKALDEMHPAIASRVLEKAWRECSGSPGNLRVERIREIMTLPGAAVSLPDGVIAEKTGNDLVFYPPGMDGFQQEIRIPGETHVPELGLSIETNVVEGSSLHEKSPIPQQAPSWYVEPLARLDYNRLRGKAYLRVRREGDRFAPLGLNGRTQKLNDFFIQRRVPRFYRSLVPLLMSGDDIAWVVGMRLDDRFKVTPGTRRMLEAVARPYFRCSDFDTACSEGFPTYSGFDS